MKLWRLRRNAYRLGRVLGDVQAIERGPAAVVKRIERRWVWRLIGWLLHFLEVGFVQVGVFFYGDGAR